MAATKASEGLTISKTAQAVLERRYLTKDENGNIIETVEGLFDRVASAIAAADTAYGSDAKQAKKVFYDMMVGLDFLPNSPTLMNAGRPLGQLSACFVLPVADSMEDIFEAIKQAALIHKSGGGTGFSFSRLRGKGATVNSTGGVASGPVSFMRVFNMATEAVKQGGTRRGANMGILRVDHPDILSFIDCKADNTDITNFNISVGVTETFMQAVLADKDYDLIDPHDHKPVGSLSAKMVYEKIVSAAWRNGEPGIIFLDRLNRFNPVPSQGEIESTNPCGEQPLMPYESCNLGSINLVNMLHRSKGKVSLDYDKLGVTTKNAVHFLDNVIDMNKYPLDKIGQTTRLTRKIGLGVMGFADMLLEMGVPYNSDEAVEIAKEVMKFISDSGREASAQLAAVRGPFPLFGESIYKDGPPLRNAAITTIAPTGTLSIIAGCSSGIEPVFAYAFIRNIMDNTKMVEVHPMLKNALEKAGIYSDELMEKVVAEGSLQHVDGIPEEISNVFVASHDVSPLYHIRIQAAFQDYTDNAVSKTVNFQNHATEEDVNEVYMQAYELGCKGVTIYRDGSRDFQVLSAGTKKEEKPAADVQFPINEKGQPTVPVGVKIVPRPRPVVTSGITEAVRIGCGKLYITVNFDENGICEIFTNTGKAGGCPSQSEATARLASIALRSGISVDELVDQLKGIRCPSTIRQQGMSATSCPDAIAKVIQKVQKIYENGGSKPPESEPVKAVLSPSEDKYAKFCAECGSALEHEGGCVICRNCGYSKCG